jgi:phosphogluconate dehydratase
MNKTIEAITQRIEAKSNPSRQEYERQMQQASTEATTRGRLSCGNLAHAFAACNPQEKQELAQDNWPNLAIVSSYNDMLSAHKTYEYYPDLIRKVALQYKAVAQFAGGVPAMCDGVTQGQAGMDLSLLSRDVIALSTAIALSHNMFDGTLCLGICDKIVPGLLIGALKFGHLPTIFVPGGPMKSGITNDQKASIRQQYAQGLISRAELLKGESASYHSAGTCTFYGTANSNQMLMEIMGLHLPGSSFVNPDTPLRTALTACAVQQLIKNTREAHKIPLYKIINVKNIVNGMVGLLATGGSTNLTLHLPAIAKAAGIHIDWQDFADLSEVVPSITRVYPNGKADINHFHAAGGMSYVTKTLLDNGLLHNDVQTVVGQGMQAYTEEPFIFEKDQLSFKKGPNESLDKTVIRSVKTPFSPKGGIKQLLGNLGKSIVKVSSVAQEHRVVQAPALVFDDQYELLDAFKEGRLHQDFIAVIRFQGPRAKGMPELHKLNPTLTVLQKLGFKVGLVTDGRMSGASGKVPSAIHCVPEATEGGLLAKLKDGDTLLLDCDRGILNCLNEAEVQQRVAVSTPPMATGTGRELFKNIRALLTSSDTGATIF